MSLTCVIVSHTHWDREWYRTFEAFRARLVDTIDGVLDLVAADPDYRFLLDGQTIVLEDYVAIRPQRRAEIEAACRAGRLGIGPWYVQPDSLLPSGEAHIRNLLEGRRTGSAFGPLSDVAYTPDSFGHPAQFPQLFAGFGLQPFVHWRGHGNAGAALPAEYLWEAPDGSAIRAYTLREGYFAASGLPRNPEAAARGLAALAERLGQHARSGAVLMMNGIDHAFPDAHIGPAAEALARQTGWTVRRALLDDFAALLPAEAPRLRGELVGGRLAHLLPGVWSTRTPLKLRNRCCEALLEGWAEPWSALGRVHGVSDETPSLRLAWRALLQNQAHDSLCGCSQDRVHEQMQFRYDTAEELAHETTTRVLERLAGLGAERAAPLDEAFEVAVFNPSPHPRTDVVRLPLDPFRWLIVGGEHEREVMLHPWARAAATGGGYTADGVPVRAVAEENTSRVRLLPELPAQSLEFIAADVPAFGWRRVRLALSDAHPETEDDGREIGNGTLTVRVDDDGTFVLEDGARTYAGLCGIEDAGDRGDTYDFDAAGSGPITVEEVRVTRRRHVGGIEHLHVRRLLSVPAALEADRQRRSEPRVRLELETEARVARGVGRVDVRVRLHNTACDHRLRLLFPTGAAGRGFHAATTFDVAARQTGAPDAAGWVHPAPSTFPHQGFVAAGGLTVCAPGLAEAEVTPDGVIAITLVRSVGWLSRMDLRSRPEPAGPVLATPGAQCLGAIEARLALFTGLDPRATRDAELGLRAVAAGSDELLPAGRPLLEVAPAALVLSALKPAEAGEGMIVRVLNPTGTAVEARLRFGFPVASAVPVRLDETPLGAPLAVDDGVVVATVGPHALYSLRVQ